VSTATIELRGLSLLDKAELRSCIREDASVVFQESSVPEHRYGEPATVAAIVAVSIPAIQGIIAWLMKSRHHGEIEREVTYTSPSGETRTTRIRVKFDSSEPPDKAVLEQIGALGVDPGVLKEVAAGS